jgi:rubrerythrin
MHRIETLEEFYAHGLAIEREAKERYAELAAHFAGQGEDLLSRLCATLARFEGEHYQDLLQASEKLELPMIPAGQYRWLGSDSPEVPARDLFHRLVKPHQLLEIALAAEVRAHEFFVWVTKTSQSLAVRELASIMAAEETEHIQWVRQAMANPPGAGV